MVSKQKGWTMLLGPPPNLLPTYFLLSVMQGLYKIIFGFSVHSMIGYAHWGDLVET